MNKPNFFIVGVARAGTSGWYNYLAQHPEVFMSPEQRANYFGDLPDDNARYFDTEEKYMWLFKNVKEEKVIGEASHYFGSEIAPKQIKAFNHKAKILIILRNPIDVLRSVMDSGGVINQQAIDFTFKELCYQHNVSRWIKFFGVKNVKILIFEEFKKNPEKAYKQVCGFLKIDNTFKPNLAKINFSYNVNYPFTIMEQTIKPVDERESYLSLI